MQLLTPETGIAEWSVLVVIVLTGIYFFGARRKK